MLSFGFLFEIGDIFIPEDETERNTTNANWEKFKKTTSDFGSAVGDFIQKPLYYPAMTYAQKISRPLATRLVSNSSSPFYVEDLEKRKRMIDMMTNEIDAVTKQEITNNSTLNKNAAELGSDILDAAGGGLMGAGKYIWDNPSAAIGMVAKHVPYGSQAWYGYKLGKALWNAPENMREFSGWINDVNQAGEKAIVTDKERQAELALAISKNYIKRYGPPELASVIDNMSTEDFTKLLAGFGGGAGNKPDLNSLVQFAAKAAGSASGSSAADSQLNKFAPEVVAKVASGEIPNGADTAKVAIRMAAEKSPAAANVLNNLSPEERAKIEAGQMPTIGDAASAAVRMASEKSPTVANALNDATPELMDKIKSGQAPGIDDVVGSAAKIAAQNSPTVASALNGVPSEVFDKLGTKNGPMTFGDMMRGAADVASSKVPALSGVIDAVPSSVMNKLDSKPVVPNSVSQAIDGLQTAAQSSSSSERPENNLGSTLSDQPIYPTSQPTNFFDLGSVGSNNDDGFGMDQQPSISIPS